VNDCESGNLANISRLAGRSVGNTMCTGDPAACQPRLSFLFDNIVCKLADDIVLSF